MSGKSNGWQEVDLIALEKFVHLANLLPTPDDTQINNLKAVLLPGFHWKDIQQQMKDPVFQTFLQKRAIKRQQFLSKHEKIVQNMKVEVNQKSNVTKNETIGDTKLKTEQLKQMPKTSSKKTTKSIESNSVKEQRDIELENEEDYTTSSDSFSSDDDDISEEDDKRDSKFKKAEMEPKKATKKTKNFQHQIANRGSLFGDDSSDSETQNQNSERPIANRGSLFGEHSSDSETQNQNSERPIANRGSLFEEYSNDSEAQENPINLNNKVDMNETDIFGDEEIEDSVTEYRQRQIKRSRKQPNLEGKSNKSGKRKRRNNANQNEVDTDDTDIFEDEIDDSEQLWEQLSDEDKRLANKRKRRKLDWQQIDENQMLNQKEGNEFYKK